MDQGVIANLKLHYRRLLLRKRVEAIDSGLPFFFNLLDAMHLLRRAWDAVNGSTIVGAFKHANFIEEVSVQSVSVPVEDEENAELQAIWDEFASEDDIELEDYLTVDERLVTTGQVLSFLVNPSRKVTKASV
jgi:hypothetical protein